MVTIHAEDMPCTFHLPHYQSQRDISLLRPTRPPIRHLEVLLVAAAVGCFINASSNLIQQSGTGVIVSDLCILTGVGYSMYTLRALRC